MTKRIAIGILPVFLLLSACQQTGPTLNDGLKSAASPSQVMRNIALAAQACWFKTKDPAFAHTVMAEETNSYSGKPRILLVPRKKPTGLPLLVIDAVARGSDQSGKFSEIAVYGPMTAGANGARIHADVKRWITGNTSCAAIA